VEKKFKEKRFEEEVNKRVISEMDKWFKCKKKIYKGLRELQTKDGAS
jgi:hypothetical protein